MTTAKCLHDISLGFLMISAAFIATSRGSRITYASIEPSVARPGERVNFTCVLDADIAFDHSGGCLWTGPHRNIAPRLAQLGSGIVSLSPDTDRRTCNFYIESVDDELNGDWYCNPVMDKDQNLPVENLVALNLTIAVKPNPPQPSLYMDSTPSEVRAVIVEESELRNFKCVSKATRPCPAFEWYLVTTNEVDLTPLEPESQISWAWMLDDPNRDKKRPLYDCYSSVTVLMDATMNSQQLRCYAMHAALEENECSTDAKLNVKGGPRIRQCNQTLADAYTIVDNFACEQQTFRFRTGKTAHISILFSANPEPTSVHWNIPHLKTPLEGSQSSKGYSATWGAATFDSPFGYWDRDDLYWANLSIKGYSTKKESSAYELELSNNYPVLESTGDGQRIIYDTDSQMGSYGEPQRINMDPQVLPTRRPGVIPKSGNSVLRFTFAVGSLPGTKNAGLQGGAVAAIVLGCLSVVLIIGVVVAAKMKGLWCFSTSYSPSNFGEYMRQSLRKYNWDKNSKRYDDVATDDPVEEDEGVQVDSSSGKNSEQSEEKPKRPAKPPPPPPAGEDLSSLDEGVV